MENDFKEWDGSYQKQPYSVLLKSDEVVICYPNAGTFTELDGSNRIFRKDEIKGIKTMTWEELWDLP